MTTTGSPAARFEHVRHLHSVTVYVHGEIDLGDRPEMRDALEAAMTPGRPIVYVDLADVTFMDASGMHELAHARRAVLRRRGRFVLVAPPPVIRLLVEVWRDTDPFEVRERSSLLDRAI